MLRLIWVWVSFQVSAVVAHSFIVQLAGNTSAKAIIDEYSLKERAVGFGNLAIGSAFRALVGEFPADTLGTLYEDPRIAAISIDRSLQLQGYVVQGQSPLHLSRLASSSAVATRPFMFDSRSGSGVDVYVFDTGIDFKHPGLSNVDVRRLDDLTGTTVPRGCDPHGHGTAVAGLVASETFGVIKRCALVDVRVADEQGKVKISQLLRGLELATGHAARFMRPSVFLIPMLAGLKSPVLSNALASMSNDIAVVLPAGNQQSEACDFTLLDRRRASNVLVVGSLDDNNHIADFSNRGDCVDVYTSGVSVTTLQSTDLSPESLLRSFNGTSASSAIGAGVVGYYMSLGLTSYEAIEKIHQVSEKVSQHPHRYELLQLGL